MNALPKASDHLRDPSETAPKMGATAPILGAVGQALFGKTRREVLTLLYGHPDRAYHMRDIARRSNCGQGAVQRELVALAEAGILTRTRCGNQVQYSANKDQPVYRELRALVLKTVGLVDVLREALAPLRENIAVAFVFGSMVSGEPNEASDVDVMVIGEATFAQVVAALSPTQDILGREVNPSVYPCDEWRERIHTHHHFVTSVAGSAKLYLIGDADELSNLAEIRLAPASSDQ